MQSSSLWLKIFKATPKSIGEIQLSLGKPWLVAFDSS
jgi:hypothetical protein